MALRMLMLNKQLNDLRASYSDLLRDGEKFEVREKELEISINEIKTDEERSVVESSISAFEDEKKSHEERKSELEKQIADIEKEIEEVRKSAPAPEQKKEQERKDSKNEGVKTMTNFFGLNVQERDAFFAKDEIKNFVANVRTAFRDVRSITNAGLTIPEVMLDLMMPIIQEKSVLMAHVDKETIKGTAREVLMGTVPEAVWTEACANLNEVSLGFNDLDFDGFKVGAYFKVCNALLEDNDVDLMRKLIVALSAAIAKAIDKAIVYGTGSHMPVGIVTRLAQTSEPSGYPSTARTWVDLHSSHILTGTGATGLNLFKEIAAAAKLVINDYVDGELVWVMNKKTHLTLKIEAANFNASAAIVSGLENYMPVAGGTIVEYKDIPDNTIVFGYFKAYKLVERKGIQIGQSEHYRFINDETVVKATARYDGKPVIAEAFGILSITSSAPSTTATFATDSANT